MAQVIAQTIVMLIFVGIGVWLGVAAAGIAFVCVGFGGRMGDGWAHFILFVIGALVCFWLAFMVAPFSLSVSLG